MSKRRSETKNHAQKVFRKTADNHQSRPKPTRGGFRL